MADSVITVESAWFARIRLLSISAVFAKSPEESQARTRAPPPEDHVTASSGAGADVVNRSSRGVAR
jgi:hypothetical protein